MLQEHERGSESCRVSEAPVGERLSVDFDRAVVGGELATEIRLLAGEVLCGGHVTPSVRFLLVSTSGLKADGPTGSRRLPVLLRPPLRRVRGPEQGVRSTRETQLVAVAACSITFVTAFG